MTNLLILILGCLLPPIPPIPPMAFRRNSYGWCRECSMASFTLPLIFHIMQSMTMAKGTQIHWLIAWRNLNIRLYWREECFMTLSTPPPMQKVKASPFMYSCAVAMRTQVYSFIMLPVIRHFLITLELKHKSCGATTSIQWENALPKNCSCFLESNRNSNYYNSKPHSYRNSYCLGKFHTATCPSHRQNTYVYGGSTTQHYTSNVNLNRGEPLHSPY